MIPKFSLKPTTKSRQGNINSINMKSISLAVLFLLLTHISFAQQNDFKIGIFGATATKTHSVGNCQVPYESPVVNGQNTSVFNVLAEDGFNICQTYAPFEWNSEEGLKSYLKLAANNNFQIELGSGHYYKPAVDVNNNYLGYGTNVYDNCGNSILPCQSPYSQNYFRADIDRYINQVYHTAPYKDIIWGYHICEEASYRHEMHYDDNCEGNVWANPDYFKLIELPPVNVNNALTYYKNNTPTDHKVVVMEARHGANINNNTIDGQDIYNPQDYLQLLSRTENRDVFFEGSYTQFPATAWSQQSYSGMFSNGHHYLGPLKSIDYAFNFTKEVHDIINIEGTSERPNYLAHFHANTNILNANWLWFQTYTAIIHGVQGVWFWELNSCWNSNETNQFINSNISNRFDRSYFPSNYKKYVAHLARELRYLVDENLISTDPSTVLYTKKDEVDPQCIVPAASTYVPSAYQQLANENYGLRYTIRTNGSDVIMIISNPLNTTVSTTLNFDEVANPLIRNAYGVDVLFETNASVSSTTYKTNRNSNINLANGTIGSQYYRGFTNGRNLTMDFGPMDVHILKFRSAPPVSYNNGWERVWTNAGNGQMDGWKIQSTDKVYAGDFDGDGAEELLWVQTNSNEEWMAVVEYDNGTWHWKWSNYGAAHALAPYRAHLVVGDFDGDGKDEVLGNDPTGWTTMFHFDNNNWNWGWSDLGNHAIRPYKDKLVAGDFDGDGKDEVLGADLPNGWTTMFHFDAGNFQWGWTDSGQVHSIRPYRNDLRVGDFDGDGKDEVLGFHTWATMFHFDNNNWNWGWSTGSSGSFNGWSYPLASSDQAIIGDLDVNDNKEEIMFLQRGPSAAWGVSMDLMANQSGWNWNWTANNTYAVPYINDWPIASNGSLHTHYMVVKAEANHPAYVLAFRAYGCTSGHHFLASMYRSTANNNKQQQGTASRRTNMYDNSNADPLQTEEDLNLTIAPNPSGGLFTVTFDPIKSQAATMIEVYNQTGQLIQTKMDITSNQIELDLSEQAAGWYVVVVKTAGKVYSEKIQLLK